MEVKSVKQFNFISLFAWLAVVLLWAALVFIFATTCYAGSVNAATAEIGNGEIGANNSGWFVGKYMRGERGPWCAGFVSYVLKKSGNKTFPYYLSSISYYKEAKARGLLTNNPKPGDLIVFWRKSKKPLVHGHIGIVERVDEHHIHTIEGNVGEYPAKVKRFTYKRGSIKRLLGFIKT